MNFLSHNLPLGFDNALSLEGVVHKLIKDMENITKKYENIELNNKEYIDTQDKFYYDKLINEINSNVSNLKIYTNELVNTTKASIESDYNVKINNNTQLITDKYKDLINKITIEIEKVTNNFKIADDLLKAELTVDILEVKKDTIERLNKFQEIIETSNFAMWSPIDGELKGLEKVAKEMTKDYLSFANYKIDDFFNALKNSNITIGTLNVVNTFQKKHLTIEYFNTCNILFYYDITNNLLNMSNNPKIKDLIDIYTSSTNTKVNQLESKIIDELEPKINKITKDCFVGYLIFAKDSNNNWVSTIAKNGGNIEVNNNEILLNNKSYKMFIVGSFTQNDATAPFEVYYTVKNNDTTLSMKLLERYNLTDMYTKNIIQITELILHTVSSIENVTIVDTMSQIKALSDFRILIEEI